MKAANHIIDLLGLSEDKDLALHFLNEAVIHGDPNMFMHNFVQYVVLPRIRSKRRK